jgi:hypothetical protein
MHSIHNKRSLVARLGGLSILASAAMLSACGGGGGSSTAGATSEVVLLAGTSASVPGTMATESRLLKTMAWTVSPQNPAANNLVVSNDTCTQTAKTDQKYTPPLGTSSTRTGASTWTCNIGVISPDASRVATDQLYNLVLTGTDDSGNSQSSTTILRVKPNASPPINYTAAAGGDFSAVSGDTVPLSCAGDAANKYQWAIVDNAGLAVSITNQSAQSSQFTAPLVTVNTILKAQCRISYSNGAVDVSRVSVTIKPPPAKKVIVSVANGGAVKPGGTINLSGVANLYDPVTKANQSGVFTYAWTAPQAPAGTQFLTPNGAKTDVVVPNTVTTASSFAATLTVTETVTGFVSSDTVTVLVDPTSALNPTITPAAQAKKGGEVATVTVNAGTSGVFYKWTVISGTNVPLGGDTTNQVSFVAPSAVTDTIVLRVAIGYTPITVANPGLYFVDAVVSVTP